VQAILAAEVGYQDLALEYFSQSIFVDLGDLHHNASDGVHVASAGGVDRARRRLRRHARSLRRAELRSAPAQGLAVAVVPAALAGTPLQVEITKDALTVEAGEGERSPSRCAARRSRWAAVDVTVPLRGQGRSCRVVPRSATSASPARGRHAAVGIRAEHDHQRSVITGSIPVGDAHAAEHGNLGIDS
jgi:alpha,alpha-trehalose phosphorylase